MTSSAGRTSPQLNKYKISRKGRKLQMFDDQRTLLALPKDVPERTWAEILQKEENDLVVFEIREDILEDAMRIGYENYMEKQNVFFTAYCASEAWLKLIDWYFYRHDPGEDPSAYPPCFIPKRIESWIPDELPDPSPKDTWCKQYLNVIEDTPDEELQKKASSSSLEMPVIEEIPSEYWFPGKVNLPESTADSTEEFEGAYSYMQDGRKRPLVKRIAQESGVWDYHESGSPSAVSEENLAIASEVLQKVTDYNTEELSAKESVYSALKTTTPVDGSLHGAGDSMVDRLKPKRRLTEKSKVFSRPSVVGRSRGNLPPLDVNSRSRISVISDCRLRNLRLETQYEVTSEKVDTPPGEMIKRK